MGVNIRRAGHAGAISLCLFLSGCGGLSLEDAEKLTEGGAGQGEAVLEMVGRYYLTAHRFVIPVIVASWIIMIIRVELLHRAQGKLKSAILGFGIILPLGVAILDTGTGVVLSYLDTGTGAPDFMALVRAAAQGVTDCAPAIIAACMVILGMGIVYLFLGKKSGTAWLTLLFFILTDVMLVLIVLFCRMISG